MPATVFTLAETTDRTGYILCVFADRHAAIDVARSNAAIRIACAHAQDVQTFGLAADHPNPYATVIQMRPDGADVFIAHKPSGERDGLAWSIRQFEVAGS